MYGLLYVVSKYLFQWAETMVARTLLAYQKVPFSQPQMTKVDHLDTDLFP